MRYAIAVAALICMTLVLAGCRLDTASPLAPATTNSEQEASALTGASSLPPLSPDEQAFLDDLTMLTVDEYAEIGEQVFNQLMSNPSLDFDDLDQFVIDQVSGAAQSAGSAEQ